MHHLAFLSIEELYETLSRGGEVEFMYGGRQYCITQPDGEINVMEAYRDDTLKVYKVVESVGDYLISGVPLKDIITKIEVTFRCF